MLSGKWHARCQRQIRTRRVDKGNRVRLEIAVSGSFGGGVLSRFEKANVGSFGGTELTLVRQSRAIIAVLLIDVLTGLGGASQVDQQPALVFSPRGVTCIRRASFSWLEDIICEGCQRYENMLEMRGPSGTLQLGQARSSMCAR